MSKYRKKQRLKEVLRYGILALIILLVLFAIYIMHHMDFYPAMILAAVVVILFTIAYGIWSAL